MNKQYTKICTLEDGEINYMNRHYKLIKICTLEDGGINYMNRHYTEICTLKDGGINYNKLLKGEWNLAMLCESSVFCMCSDWMD